MPYNGKVTLPPKLNAAAVLCLQVLSAAGSMILIALLSRSLDAAELAAFFYVLAVATGLESLSDLGLRFSAVRRQMESRSDSELSKWIVLSWCGKGLLSAFAVLAILLGWQVQVIVAPGQGSIFYMCAILVSLPSACPFTWTLRARNLQWLEGLLLVVYRALIVFIVYMISGQDMAASNGLSAVLFGNFCYWLLAFIGLYAFGSDADRRLIKQGRDYSGALAMATEAFPLGIALLGGQLASRLGTIVLGLLGQSIDLTLFAIAQSSWAALLLVGPAIGIGFQSNILLSFGTSARAFSAAAEEMARFALSVSVSIAIGALLVAPALLPVLFAEFGRAAVPVFGLLCVALPFSATNLALRYILAPTAGRWAEAATSWAAVFLIFAFSMSMGRDRGASAVVLAILLAETLALAARVVVLGKTTDFRASNFAKKAVGILAVGGVFGGLAAKLTESYAMMNPFEYLFYSICLIFGGTTCLVLFFFRNKRDVNKDRVPRSEEG